MNAHTPGPWTLQDDDTFSTLGDKRIIGADCISPAIVFGGIKECEANADLIAAAPDLLAACRAFINADLGEGYSKGEQQAIGMMHAAILKAEGR